MSYEELATFRRRANLRQQDIADAMGVTPGQVSRWESGKNALPITRLNAMAQAYKVSQEEMWGAMLGELAAGGKIDPALPSPNATVVPMEGASIQRMARDIPLFGTAIGATKMVEGDAVEQTTLNTGDIIGYARRPVILDGRADAYGLYVSGSSMSPVHEEGDMILAETKRPPRIGEDVVVYLRPENEDDDGERARAVLVKRLTRRTSDFIELQQFNPPTTFRLSREQYVRIDRVLRLADLID